VYKIDQSEALVGVVDVPKIDVFFLLKQEQRHLLHHLLKIGDGTFQNNEHDTH